MADWGKKDSHNEWWTPRDLVAILDAEFMFDLDAAATEENKVCEKFISAEQDALTTPWDDFTVWCNPPYERGMIPAFVQRAYEQHLEQKNTVVMLLPTYTDPKYWRDYCTKAHEIRHLTGRLKFLDNGKTYMSARFPSSVVIFKWFPGVTYKAPHIWTWDWRAQNGTV